MKSTRSDKWAKIAITIAGSIAMTFMMNTEDQRLKQAFGEEKGEKVDTWINMVIGAFLSGMVGLFTGLTGIKIYSGNIETVIGNALIDHGKETIGEWIKKTFGYRIPVIGKTIGQFLLEFLLSGGFTTLIQTTVNLIIKYLKKLIMKVILPFIAKLVEWFTDCDLLAAIAAGY